MPVSGALLVSDADIKVKRSPSLRSEQSSVSESRQVRFNQDVSVKRIPKKVVKTKSLPLEAKDEFSGKCQGFTNLPPPASEQEIASEAEAILRHLEEIQCSVSSSPTARASSPPRPVTSPTPPSQAGSVGNLSQRSNSRHNTLEKKSRSNTLEKKAGGLLGLAQRFSRSSSDLGMPSVKIFRGLSGSRRDLAMRVEGHSEIEDSPRAGDRDDARYYGLQALSNLDSKVNGDNKLNNHNYRNQQAANEYSVPVKKNNITPPKPPRKAPSASPPSIRRGYMSHDELDFKNRRSELFDPTDSGMETGGPYSYTERNPSLGHVRESQGTMNSRQSPGRGQAGGQGGNHTDSEILNSPTQVLYATISADKHKHGGNLKNHYMANSASQTIHSGFRPISADRHLQSRTMSKENILDEPPYRPQTAGKHGTRSLERFVDDDKENFKRRQEMKARIHVSSPIRMSPERQSNGHSNGTAARKPYRTTINTATDTIQYNGFNRENLRRTKVDNEHYKVPRNKAPVPPEFMPSRRMEADHHNGPRAKSVGGGSSKGQFSSASLVRNAERRGNNGHAVTRGAGSRGGEFDREGRRIHQERNRAYSGYSTSPDRELSPDRYAKPRPGGHSRSLVRRSPSTSPTRPPRTKSSPSREVHIPVRREHSGRVVERTPSTRASATSRSPIKKIQRVHNEIIGDTGGYREPSPTKSRTLTLRRNQDKGARGTKTLLMNKPVNNKQPEVADDRLSRFTEYRGTSEEPRSALAQSRRSSTGYDLRKNSDSSGGQFERDRERGQSVPPGANIDSMKDFYKTNQYRSMYHLPPSPSRPAPVLQRERSSDQMVAPPRRSKTSVSEGEITDGDGVRVATINRANKFLNIIPGRRSSREEAHHRDTGAATLSRRLGSGDRDRNQIYGELNNRRVASKERPMRRPAPQPPGHKVRRSSVDVLETSHSESESPRPEQLRLYSEEDHEELDWTEPLTRHRITVSHKGPRSHVSHVSHVSSARGNGHVLYLDSLDTLPHPRYQTKLAGVPVHSDMDSDYRRDMIAGSVHMEARTRDGGHGGPGVAPPSIYQQAASLNRDKSVSKGRLDIRGRSEDRGPRTREVEISQDDDEDEVVSRAPIPLSREEERRKILELERRSGGGQQRTASVSRSGSRVSSKLMPGNKGPKSVAQRLLNTETENESQYSGHSAASVKRPVGSRYNTGPGNRIKRTGSSATTSSARQVISRKKMPGSVTSSVNSSESENGQSAISRATNQSAVSNRSVFLHATAVADIPSAKPGSNGAPGLGETKQFGGSSNLQKSKKISRSISLLAPFKKQQSSRNGVVGGPEKEVIYDSSGQIVQPGSGSGKPPRAPPASRKSPGELQSIMTSRDKKFSASSSDLLDNEAEVMSSPEDVQVARSQIIAASNNSKNQGKVSRSVSMPKDTRLAGWFKKRKRV